MWNSHKFRFSLSVMMRSFQERELGSIPRNGRNKLGSAKNILNLNIKFEH